MKSFHTYFKWTLVLLLAFFSYLMLEITLPYFSFESKVGFLKVKQSAYTLWWWRLAFYVHVMISMLALLAGFIQFSPWIRKNHRYWHINTGKIYIAVILFFSAPSGLLMAFYARGGWISASAFTVLAILWWVFTFLAARAVAKRNFQVHQHMMIRSYALTLSAVTLRAWKWLIVFIWHPRPMEVYLMVAWLGFIPNMIIAELIIARLKSKMKRKT